jgi:hypothetical protein
LTKFGGSVAATGYVERVPDASDRSLRSAPGSAVACDLDARIEAAYDENGVDRSLIRWSLARTPTERVRAVEETLNALATVRRISPPR